MVLRANMAWTVRWSKRSLDELSALPKLTTARILHKIDWFARQPQPLRFAKPLSGLYAGVCRFRVGDYRVIFEVINSEPRVLMVLRVVPRRDAY